VRAAVVALLQADTDGAACRALAKALGVSTERGDDDFAEDAIDQRIADALLSLAPAARGTEPTVAHIAQRGDWDCGVASLAMAAGVSYENALAVVPESQRGERLNTIHFTQWLGALGCAVRKVYEDTDGLRGIRLIAHRGHFVVARPDGLVNDPARGAGLPLANYDNPFDVWEVHRLAADREQAVNALWVEKAVADFRELLRNAMPPKADDDIAGYAADLSLDTIDNALEHDEGCHHWRDDAMGDRLDCTCGKSQALHTLWKLAHVAALGAATRGAREPEGKPVAWLEQRIAELESENRLLDKDAADRDSASYTLFKAARHAVGYHRTAGPNEVRLVLATKEEADALLDAIAMIRAPRVIHSTVNGAALPTTLEGGK
jgi:hypothetical protein